MRMRLMVIGRGVIGLAVAGGMGCRPSDVLSVPAPAGVVSTAALQSQGGAESAFNGAKGQLFNAADGPYYSGLLVWSGLLTDEFTFSGFTEAPYYANIDARETVGGAGFYEAADDAWGAVLTARSALLV